MKMNGDTKNKEITGSVGRKIALTMIIGVIVVLSGVGLVTYQKVQQIDELSFSDNVDTTLATTDAALDNYFSNIVSDTKLFAEIDLVREPDESITSYVELSDPSGKVKMDVAKFSDYEKKIYDLEKVFTLGKDEIIGVSVALESNGAFVRYPEESRSNNYDSRKRSWYKNAKAKNGAVNLSDAYVASAGYKAIVSSVYLKDKTGKDRGVVSVDANVDYLSEIMRVSQDGVNDSKFLLIDKSGTILVDQLNPSNEFKKLSDLKMKQMEGFKHGDIRTFQDTIDGVKYIFRTSPTKNKYFPFDYVVISPVSVVHAANNAVLHTMIPSILIGALISAALALMLSRIIRIPLKKTAELLRDISEGDGDLSQRLPVSGNDEITLVSKYFNMTFDKISGVVKSVMTESQVMNSVSENLSSSMSETASAINQISSNVASVKNEVVNQSAGVEQTSATIQQINGNIEKLTLNIENQSNAVSQSSSAIEEMVANIRSVTDILEKNQKSVTELSDSAEKGKTVVDKAVSLIDQISADSEGLMEASTVIQNIASQTNLLAMNAAIEAAHAGDVGKGFSVVADEIRKLAEDSSTQGKRISDALVGLKDLITTVGGASKEIQSQFNVIFENTQKVSQQETVIKSAMDEQSSGSQQILNAMQDITNITGEVKQGAILMEQGGKEIIVEMNKLASVTAEISGSMNEISTGISEINNAMQSVNEKTVENSDSINRVNNEINKFKV